MLYNFSNVIKNHNHTIITAVLVTAVCVFEYGLESLLLISGFWLGREHFQAEYRFMKQQGITREDLGQDTKDLRAYRQALRDSTKDWIMPKEIF